MNLISPWVRRQMAKRLPDRLALRRHAFLGSDQTVPEERFERITTAFLAGLRAAGRWEVPSLHAELTDPRRCDRWSRGFAFEGAAMGVGLLQAKLPWRRHLLRDFASGWGRNYIYLIHVGAGWAAVHGHVPAEACRLKDDPLLGWLAADGFGFCTAINAANDDDAHRCLAAGSGYTAHVLWQGYGRALWFLARGTVSVIQAAIAAAPPQWREDMWSGIGLACIYAGRLEAGDLRQLRQAAQGNAPSLAQGAAFAARARKLSGDLDPTQPDAAEDEIAYSHAACQELCGCDAHAAAAVTDDALDALPPDGDLPAYEVWRRRIRSALADGNHRPHSHAQPRRRPSLCESP